MDIPIKGVIHRAEQGRLWAEIPGLPGCATEGESMEECTANLRKAIEGCFGATQDDALGADECEPGEVITL